MKLLGIDHGTNYAGWATMRNGRLLEFASRDFTKIKMPEVLDTIYRDACNLIRSHRPDILVLERPVHFENATTVLALVGAYSVVTLAALHLGIRIETIRPSELKMQTGRGNADKETVALDMAMRFGLEFDQIAIPVLYKVDGKKGKAGEVKTRLYDPADAIALCWAYHQKTTSRS
ncbi:crossover junction endodeoxyribonuclease RuvC [Paenibacillus ginsengarvi]|uniref:Crossover junction endodeoxyribonuclease RuvC n=1 Tax=Paenibacillus ginsengarvi TaxID=400777 RepID=A0A3B0BNR6_9BACL|nr:crossover junction endodeoxyribonuclease RuvC [Paenibacillus ginsengarvi]RKN75033.1 crossover junction endodeoxyribonuclease RuvC [Paenibacillus ginsengarvi]